MPADNGFKYINISITISFTNKDWEKNFNFLLLPT
jgi:hypothetical protein